MGWGDEYENKQGQEEKIKYGRIFSFKTMSYAINKIREETKDWDSKHPKDDLISMWMNCMLVFLILFTFT